MTAEELHRLASLMVRDHTISAKQHSDLARSSRAMASTWRQVLDVTARSVLSQDNEEDSVLGAPASTLDEPAALRREYD